MYNSACIIAGQEGLLMEILKRLPVISLLRFKSVSKYWFSIITDSHFQTLLNPNSIKPYGFFLPSCCQHLDFVPFNVQNPIKPPLTRLSPPPEIYRVTPIKIISSCNGLFCVANVDPLFGTIGVFFLYNPSCKKPLMIPQPHIGDKTILGVNLVYEPLKSPTSYKLICLVEISGRPTKVRIFIYSSETSEWKPSLEFTYLMTRFFGEVYFNGSIHWYSWGFLTNYFNVDREEIQVMPMPTLPHGSSPSSRNCHYFGESSGHVHLIETHGSEKLEFGVFEMEKDCSGWFLRYKVDLNPMANTYPEMVSENERVSSYFYGYKLIYVSEDENSEDSYMMLYIPGKIMQYNFVDKSFKLLFEYNTPAGDDHYFSNNELVEVSYPFVPSLARI